MLLIFQVPLEVNVNGEEEVPVNVRFVTVCVVPGPKEIVFPPRPLAVRVPFIVLLPEIFTESVIVRLLKVFEPLSVNGAAAGLSVTVPLKIAEDPLRLFLKVHAFICKVFEIFIDA